MFHGKIASELLSERLIYEQHINAVHMHTNAVTPDSSTISVTSFQASFQKCANLSDRKHHHNRIERLNTTINNFSSIFLRREAGSSTDTSHHRPAHIYNLFGCALAEIWLADACFDLSKSWKFINFWQKHRTRLWHVTHNSHRQQMSPYSKSMYAVNTPNAYMWTHHYPRTLPGQTMTTVVFLFS